MSKMGGSCGGPYWPVRQSPTEHSEKFEQESKRIAFKHDAEFAVVNQLPRHSPWWRKNKVYLKYIEFLSDLKKRKYKINKRPALVVSLNEKFLTLYDWDDLEKKVNKFIITAM